MAEVYRRVRGYTLEKFIAKHEETFVGMADIVNRRTSVARGILAAHRAEGDSRITQEWDGLDWTVSLDDTRGDRGAMSIEKGRRRYTIGPRQEWENVHGLDKNGNTVAGMTGINALGAAFDLPDDGRQVF